MSAACAKLRKRLESEGYAVISGAFDLPEFMCNNPAYLKIPPTSDLAFAHKMLTVCLDAGIEKLYLLNPKEWELLSEAVVLFDEYGINLIKAND